MTDSHLFDFYGVTLRLNADKHSSKAFTDLKKDFDFFSVHAELPAGQSQSYIEVYLRQEEDESAFQRSKKNLAYFFDTQACRVYGGGPRRVCNFRNQTWLAAENMKSSRCFHLCSPNSDELRELGFTVILSSVGEALDGKGFHRIHSAGLSYKNSHFLLVLPQGGGKSAISAILTQNPQVKIFSDEAPLLRNGKIYPFPIRLALHRHVAEALHLPLDKVSTFQRKLFPSKIIFSIPNHSVAKPSPIDFILVGDVNQRHENPQIGETTAWKTFSSLFKNMVVGLGLSQMAEHMLRTDNLYDLAFIGASRLREAAKTMAQAEAYSFKVSSDAAINAKCLLDFLESRTTR